MGTQSINERANAWIVGGDTGISSKVIWAVMMGCVTPPVMRTPPQDPSDFGRCYRLLKLIPEWKLRLGEVEEAMPRWRPYIREWERLQKMYVMAIHSGAKTAPAMYQLMRECAQDHTDAAD